MMKMNRKINFVHKTGHSGHQLDTIQFRSVTADKFRSYKLDTISGEGKAGIFETSCLCARRRTSCSLAGKKEENQKTEDKRMTEQQQKIMNDYLSELEQSRVRTSSHAKQDVSVPTLRRTRIKASAKSPLTAFFQWVNDRGLDYLRLRIIEAQEFQLHLATKTNDDGSVHYSKVTVSTMVDRVRRFYDYLRKKKLIHSNPFNEIQAIKRKKAIPKNILNEEQMSLFLRHLREFNKAGSLIEKRRLYRAHVLAEFMYSTGARINEVMKIRREDIDFLRNTVTVHDDKTDKSRECILNEYASKVLRIFIDEMRRYVLVENVKRGDSVFGATSSLIVWLNNVFTAESVKLGLPKVTTHHFRHAVGFHLLRAGCDIRYIKEILGHEELGTTQIYTKVDKLDLKSVIDEFHPRKMRQQGPGSQLPARDPEADARGERP
jgi:site-specific recombinase XerD